MDGWANVVGDVPAGGVLALDGAGSPPGNAVGPFRVGSVRTGGSDAAAGGGCSSAPLRDTTSARPPTATTATSAHAPPRRVPVRSTPPQRRHAIPGSGPLPAPPH
ncbi:hypothetical protein [Streptomyces sp. NPDC012508]|uniref:hypothetical protein n=1 Tax=Streptomyces sp. NPDC012508 TaxID=3364837 RepID=UPI0036A61EC4